jgi:2,3-bisphosphoglycerate-independent phosphoglycerate mutase
MRWLVLIVDGASGWPAEALGGRTSLEAAHTPNLDALSRRGAVGLSHTVPAGMEPSSAIACMSVLGFDPSLYYAGRGPIEALALGIDLAPGEAALRCNLVTVTEGVLRSYSAGHISSTEAHRMMADVQAALGNDRIRFHPGVAFRNILTVRDGEGLLRTRCAPAHDLADKPVNEHLPRGPEAPLLIELMDRSVELLADHPVNLERLARGELPATQIWLFWPGLRPGTMPSFSELYSRRAAVTTGVDLLRGLARQIGMDVLDIPGVTDGSDNDYAGQMEGALAALREYEMVVVHVEAPDDAGHAGDAAEKVEAIERVDALMVPQALEWADELALLVMPDHPTPLALKTHVPEPVPFVMWGKGVQTNGAQAFTEAAAAATGLEVAVGHSLMGRFLSLSG